MALDPRDHDAVQYAGGLPMLPFTADFPLQCCRFSESSRDQELARSAQQELGKF